MSPLCCVTVSMQGSAVSCETSPGCCSLRKTYVWRKAYRFVYTVRDNGLITVAFALVAISSWKGWE